MKTLRIVGLVGCIVLALLAILGGTLYALFDGEKVKRELARAVMEKTQRRLDISGPLKLSLWPNVGVSMGHAVLTEQASKQEFLTLDSARVAVVVMPLLAKKVVVNEIEVDGLHATLIKRKDGTLNIADLTGGKSARDAKAEQEKSGGGETAPVQIDVAGVKLTNAQLTWRDEKAGSTTTLSGLNFSTGHVAADSGRQTLAVESVALATHGQSGSDAFDIAFAAPQLILTPEQVAGKSLSLSAQLSGSGRQATARLVLSGMKGSLHALKVAKLDLDVDAQSGATMVKAHLASPLAVNLAAQTWALEKITGQADIVHPAMPMKQVHLPLNGSARIDLAKQTATIKLTTQFDESKMLVGVDVNKFAPLALGFDLVIDRLNIDKYLPPKPAAAQTAQTAQAETTGQAAGDAALDFSALKGWNLDGAVRIGSLQAAKLKFARLNARLRVANGRLDLAPLAANLYEGSMNGSASVNANGNTFALRQTLAGVSINPLLKDLADKDLLAGKGTVMVDVTGHGATVSALKKSLAGSASLALRDGAIKGINLAQSLRDIKAKLGAQQDTVQQSRGADKTDFSELTASFRIADGVAHNEDLAMKSPFLRLAGAGDVDIGNGRINYLAKASVVNTGAGQGGKEADQLKGVTVPVRVTGPFENIAWKIDFASAINDAVREKARARIEEKKQEIQQKAGDRLKEKFKGLFGK